MKNYFFESDSEICYPEFYFKDYMKREGISELKVFEAKRETNTGYFWCKVNLEIGEVGEGCGNICPDYKPRNGKKGRCLFSGFF